MKFIKLCLGILLLFTQACISDSTVDSNAKEERPIGSQKPEVDSEERKLAEERRKTIEYIQSSIEGSNFIETEDLCLFEYEWVDGVKVYASINLSDFTVDHINTYKDRYILFRTKGLKRTIYVKPRDAAVDPKATDEYLNRYELLVGVKKPEENLIEVKKALRWLVEHCKDHRPSEKQPSNSSSFEEVAKQRCSSCSGSGVCSRCKGEGTVLCGKYVHDTNGDGYCKRCKNSGRDSCIDCFGSGKCEKCKGSGEY